MFKIGHLVGSVVLDPFTRSGKARAEAKWSRRWAALRLTAFVSAVGFGGILFCAHGAKAAVGESIMAIGRDLAPLADIIGSATSVDLNGERMTLGYAISDESIKTVMDRFQAHCDANPAASFADAWGDLAKLPTAQRPKEAEAFQKGFVQRTDDEREGTIICFTNGAKSESTIKKAWEKFDKAHDLGYLGKARLAFAEKDKFGKTIILTAWTEDSFNVDKLAPPEGAEPGGTDSTIVGRPPRSKRILTATLLGKPYGVRFYESTESMEALGAFYEHDMAERGWTSVTTDLSAPLR